MKYPNKLTFKSINKLIKSTSELREKEVPHIEAHPGTIKYLKNPENKKWRNENRKNIRFKIGAQ